MVQRKRYYSRTPLYSKMTLMTMKIKPRKSVESIQKATLSGQITFGTSASRCKLIEKQLLQKSSIMKRLRQMKKHRSCNRLKIVSSKKFNNTNLSYQKSLKNSKNKVWKKAKTSLRRKIYKKTPESIMTKKTSFHSTSSL